MNFQKKILILLILVFIMNIGFVSAENITDNKIITPSDNTFDDIQDSINNCSEGDVVELNGTYVSSNKYISVNNSITIQGSSNGAVLDGNDLNGIFFYYPFYKVNVTFKNLNFTNYGSTCLDFGDLSTVNVINCTFINCYSQYKAGAINCGNVYLVNCTFINNFAQYYGGVIVGEEISALNCTFINNSAQYGGVINGGNVFVDNGNFLNSTASYYGGAIYADNVSVINCNFLNCHAGNYGGAIKSNENVYAINSTFRDNLVNYDYGGAIHSVNSTVFNCSFINNKANNDGRSSIMNGGGAIFSDYLNMSSSIFLDNYAYGNGGAVHINAFNNSYISNCSFINNSITYYGGAVSTYGGTSIINCEFINNSAYYYGGAINSNSIIPYFDLISNCNFLYNTAQYGGAIFMTSDGNLSIVKSHFENNTSPNAGVLYVDCYGYDADESICKISDSTFINNSKNSNLASIYTGGAELFIINNKKTIKYSKPIVLDDSLKVYPYVEVTSNKLSTFYKSGRVFKINISYGYNKKPFTKSSIFTIVYPKGGGGSYYDAKEYYLYSKNGIYTLKLSDLDVGSYKVDIELQDIYLMFGLSGSSYSIKISKIPTIIKAPKVFNKYKKSKYFKITVKNKATNKAVKNLKLKVKVYTSKKYKTYNIKTNKNGIASINTKKLKIGTHKVIISSNNLIYQISAKSTIKIKK